MSKKDIKLICDLHLNEPYLGPFKISRNRKIKYGFRRVKKLIKQLDRFVNLNNNELPQNYVDFLFNFMNKNHLNRERCNEFIIRTLQ